MSSSASNGINDGASKSCFCSNNGSLLEEILRFTGQTSWQISQPNTQSPIKGLSSRGIEPRSSIVRNEMQRRLSITYGATQNCQKLKQRLSG